MKDYSIKIVNGHHVVDMIHKPNDIEIAIRNAAKSYGDLIKGIADGIQKKWGMK